MWYTGVGDMDRWKEYQLWAISDEFWERAKDLASAPQQNSTYDPTKRTQESPENPYLILPAWLCPAHHLLEGAPLTRRRGNRTRRR